MYEFVCIWICTYNKMATYRKNEYFQSARKPTEAHGSPRKLTGLETNTFFLLLALENAIFRVKNRRKFVIFELSVRADTQGTRPCFVYLYVLAAMNFVIFPHGSSRKLTGLGKNTFFLAFTLRKCHF